MKCSDSKARMFLEEVTHNKINQSLKNKIISDKFINKA